MTNLFGEENTEGIVLRSIVYQERSRILTIFTSQAGLISLIVKNISRKNPLLLSLSTPFSVAEWIYTKGRSELFRFQDGTLLDDMMSLRGDLKFLQTAGSFAQTILQSQLFGKTDPLLYSLFIAYMKQIPHFGDLSVLASSFYLKLLHHDGTLALRSLCSVCRSLPVSFIHQGECVCREHAPSGSIAFSGEELRVLEQLLSTRSFIELKKIESTDEVYRKIVSLLTLATKL